MYVYIYICMYIYIYIYIHIYTHIHIQASLVASDCKESACNVGDLGSIPWLGRSPGEENGYPLQYSCLKNPMDRGAWGATVLGVTKSGTQLSTCLK